MDISSFISLLLTLAYAALAGVAWTYQARVDKQLVRWLLPVLITGFLASLVGIIDSDTRLLDNEALAQPAIVVYMVSLLFVFYGSLTMEYLKLKQLARLWLLPGLLWWAVSVGLNFAESNAQPGQPEWFVTSIEDSLLPGIITMAGWMIIGLILLSITFFRAFRARLPEIANQSLFWAFILPFVLLGGILSTGGESPMNDFGRVFLFLGVSGLLYGVISLRVLDIRQTIRTTVFNITLIITSSLIILGALVATISLDIENDAVLFLVLIFIALITALVAIPLSLLIGNITRRILQPAGDDQTFEIGRYTDAFMGVVELPELANVIRGSLRDLMRVRRGCLLMLNEDEDNLLKITPYPINMGEIPGLNGWLSLNSPIYKTLYNERKPLAQYDLNFSQEYKKVGATEKTYFDQLHMAAYAPIIVEEKLIGILACGPKISDDPFYPSDMNTLTSLANQASVALRNARLVDDLRKREQDIAESNRRLEGAKRQLEALDAVKTDFITIASHELRTPLAQIRGHTDIIEALNQQGMLEQDQLQGLTNNLRKAADRLESLIGDMLDVSQLDLSAMDLRFSQTTIENVVRLAIEPLQESIRNRKQSLTARGLRGLPALHADMQRLVQAIRNVVLNAVKFTPDGGRIDIMGSLQVNEETGQDEILLKIKDSGIGIDPKNHEAIFEKFFRIGDPGLHSTGKTKFMGAGPGLGLTIARGVITGHNGTIRAESDGFDPEELPGSTFFIILPVKPPEERRNISFGTTTGSTAVVRDSIENTRSSAIMSHSTESSPPEETKPEAVPAAPLATDAKDEKPFVEENRTVLNPSASRVGLAAAAREAAEQAKADEEDTEDGEPDS